ncbi:polysaccharide pyruvyl transferase family protein [Shewanella aestuarii]|uniref:Polysaccharide pyruvyl transferase family protein n=1 Tax=Shewanella aestuarii TaxID=1028752 RepID=A0A6G9QMR3_9GAMM|nr:polysaccharide pyruvyl transferase family protein [Shewanella aestuarii]QIR15111.1 polysaccharide pyruvyl transferase family protein [Shewanella aestuarii]
MIIEIKGVQFVNKGAELMLYAVLQQIEKLWPYAEIALRACPNSPYLKRARLGAWQKVSIRKHIIDLNTLTYSLPYRLSSSLKRLGIVTEADIDLVLDASGFAYGDQWPIRQLTHVSHEISRYHVNKKPYIFLPQAFGPFSNKTLQSSIKAHWGKSALIFARDKVSESHLSECLGKDNQTEKKLHLMPDFTNLVTGNPIGLKNADKTVLFIPNGKMISHRNGRKSWISNYTQLMSRMCREVNDAGFTPVLLNHDGAKDAKLCEQIIAGSGLELQTVTLDNPLDVKGAIGEVAAVVSSRFHGCVSALCQGIPCIGTSWSHKYEELFADYGQQKMLITTPENDKLSTNIKLLLSDDYANECRDNPAIALQKAQSERMWSLVFEKVGEFYD